MSGASRVHFGPLFTGEPTGDVKSLVFQADDVDALLLWREVDVVQIVRQIDDLAQGGLAGRRGQRGLHVQGVGAWMEG